MRNEQPGAGKLSLASYSSGIKEIVTSNKQFGNKIEMKQPSVIERCRRCLLPIAEEDITIRQLVQQGKMLILSICQIKYTDTLRTETWYLNGSVLYCSLYSCLHKNRTIFTEINIFIFSRQIYYALKYLHRNDLIHGNLTSHAIQIMDTYSVRLSNFEYMHVKGREQKWPSADSWRWMAPETLLKKQSFLKSDIFSFCCVCLECFGNRLPWDKHSQHFVEKHYMNGNIFPQDNFLVRREIKECFSNGLATKTHRRRLNFHHFETVMVLRTRLVCEYNLNNSQINLSTPDVSETRYSEQSKTLNQQQLNISNDSLKSTTTKICTVLKNEKSVSRKIFNSNDAADNKKMTMIKSDTVKFLIKYFENFSSSKNINSNCFNLKNLRRRTISSLSSERSKISKAFLLLKRPDDLRYICNKLNDEKTLLQNSASEEKLQPKVTSLKIENAQTSNSDIGNHLKSINNLVYLRRQRSVSQTLSFKRSSPEKLTFSEHFDMNSSFVASATRGQLDEKDCFENGEMEDVFLLIKRPVDLREIRSRLNDEKTPLQNSASEEKLQLKDTSLKIENAQTSNSDIGNHSKGINNLVYLRRQISVPQTLSFKRPSPDSSFVPSATREYFNVERNFFENGEMKDASPSRRKSFPLYKAASTMPYLKLNERYSDNLDAGISLSSDKISSKSLENNIYIAPTNRTLSSSKEYVKYQVDKWEKNVNEHVHKSKLNYQLDYCSKYYNVPEKINSWEEKIKQ